MAGEIEHGNCDICGTDGNLRRKYYYYDIHCDCCGGGDHFEIVRFCDTCNPKPPNVVKVVIKPKSSR